MFAFEWTMALLTETVVIVEWKLPEAKKSRNTADKALESREEEQGLSSLPYRTIHNWGSYEEPYYDYCTEDNIENKHRAAYLVIWIKRMERYGKTEVLVKRRRH
uniref:Anoctamin n=1 Tax=Steinernema glaseri TaxID=37863 RepID=A0A1I7XX35_9BILA